MSFEQYWNVVVKRWKLVVICFLVLGLGTLIVCKLTTPRYQSVSLMEVAITAGSSQADYNNLLASDQLVQTEAQLATSDPVLSAVASHYPGLSTDTLTRQVSATSQINTQLFSITVLDANPKRAAQLANDIAQTLMQQQAQMTQQDNVRSQQQLQTDLTKTHQQIDAMTAKIASSQASGDQTQVSNLQPQLTALQQHYNQVQTLLGQLELTQAQNGNFLRIVQYAQPALTPAQPKVLLYTAAGFAAGLLLGLLLALLYDQLDTRVRTAEQLTELLEWPLLGTIWRTVSSDKSETINPQGRDANVEAYRILRTNVGFSEVDKVLRSMVVTSAMPGDGKSTIAANLAIYMAKTGKNTLLVDADLRRPTQYQNFNIAPDRQGLSNAILAQAAHMSAHSGAYTPAIAPTFSRHLSGSGIIDAPFSLAPFIHPVNIPNLQVMPSGPIPPNPSELLDSKAMTNLLAAITSVGADVVVIDCPPLLGISDTNILASKVDGVLVVIDSSRATKANLKQIKNVLMKSGANVLGCILNKQRRSRNDSSYGYYYYTPDDRQNKREQNMGTNVAVTPPHALGRNPAEVGAYESRTNGPRSNG